MKIKIRKKTFSEIVMILFSEFFKHIINGKNFLSLLFLFSFILSFFNLLFFVFVELPDFLTIKFLHKPWRFCFLTKILFLIRYKNVSLFYFFFFCLEHIERNPWTNRVKEFTRDENENRSKEKAARANPKYRDLVGIFPGTTVVFLERKIDRIPSESPFHRARLQYSPSKKKKKRLKNP